MTIIQRAMISIHSPQRAGRSPLRAMKGIDDTPPLTTFYRARVSKTGTSFNVSQKERVRNVEQFCSLYGELPLVAQDTV